MSNKVGEKIRLFALIEPLNLRMSLCFPSECLVADIHNFIDDVMRRYTIKYRVGRIEWNGAWILPQYKIEDFLEDKSDITVYSVEYGLTLKNLSGERDRLHINYSVFDQDINTKFINKKTVKDKKRKVVTSRTNENPDNIENDDEFSQPQVGVEYNEELEKDTKGKSSLLPPKDVQRKDKNDQARDSKPANQPHQPTTKKKGDEASTKSTSQSRNDKKNIVKNNSSESENEEHIHINDKYRKTGQKKYSKDENDNNSSDEEEDISYPKKTNQPLDKRINDNKRGK